VSPVYGVINVIVVKKISSYQSFPDPSVLVKPGLLYLTNSLKILVFYKQLKTMCSGRKMLQEIKYNSPIQTILLAY